jgi:hypothetical protein
MWSRGHAVTAHTRLIGAAGIDHVKGVTHAHVTEREPTRDTRRRRRSICQRWNLLGDIHAHVDTALGKQAPTSKPGPASFAAVFVARTLVAFVLSVFVGYTHADSAIPGIEIGFLSWLGFIFPLGIGPLAFGQGRWKSFLMGTIEALLGLLVMGAIIGAWH